mmetsp:Transcript_116375/g.202361  ORF Transcript_116375/g.202361 Transcript_116375/m.202361 type:complete len:302 (+) Transcript_116375:944-1849(+)
MHVTFTLIRVHRAEPSKSEGRTGIRAAGISRDDSDGTFVWAPAGIEHPMRVNPLLDDLVRCRRDGKQRLFEVVGILECPILRVAARVDSFSCHVSSHGVPGRLKVVEMAVDVIGVRKELVGVQEEKPVEALHLRDTAAQLVVQEFPVRKSVKGSGPKGRHSIRLQHLPAKGVGWGYELDPALPAEPPGRSSTGHIPYCPLDVVWVIGGGVAEHQDLIKLKQQMIPEPVIKIMRVHHGGDQPDFHNVWYEIVVRVLDEPCSASVAYICAFFLAWNELTRGRVRVHGFHFCVLVHLHAVQCAD